jgi:membrane-associated phospholipid phosphatase
VSSSRLDRAIVSGLVSWRALAVGITVIAFFWSWWVVGPPVTRPDQLLWILVIILVANVGRGLSIPRILVDWLPLFVILYLYDYTRGWTTSLGIPTHYVWALNADKFLFHGTVPTQWLQIHFYDPSVVHWYDKASGLVYLSHFFASLALATGLYIYSRDRWAAFMRRFILLSLAGLTTYVLFPAAPPWLANQRGLLPDVSPITGHGLAALHLAPTETWLRLGAAHANYVAAVPSLHAGFSMLVALFLIFEGRRPWRRIWMLAYPIAMGLAIVYCAEHYVVDVLLGWAYAGAVMLICGVWERQRDRRRLVRAQRDGDDAQPSADADPDVVGVPAG